ncbi:MAG: sporulation sigma factor SigE, partial [Oscillospiraceae bacterium]|nr:sporulation sigma factor SigE [Oscillospiraceae bacterium]
MKQLWGFCGGWKDLLRKLVGRITGRKSIYYINGPENLPPPLSREAEQKAFRQLEEKSPEARQTLIVHNLRLVVYIARKFESTGIGVEDLISIG